MEILKTNLEDFKNIEDWEYKENFYTVRSRHGDIDIHYIDENSDKQETILLMHGNPTWGYLYRKMSLYLTVLLLILGHSGGGSQWAFSTYGLQVLTPDRLRGRIAGIDYSLYFLMNTISTLMIGYLAISLKELLQASQQLLKIYQLKGILKLELMY